MNPDQQDSQLIAATAFEVADPYLGVLHESRTIRLELRKGQPPSGSRRHVIRARFVPDELGWGYLWCHVNPRSLLAELLEGHVTLWDGRCSLHRLVGALSTGYLEAYQVHHVNGNALDNRASNLEVVDADEHQALHRDNPRRGILPNPAATDDLWLVVHHKAARATMDAAAGPTPPTPTSTPFAASPPLEPRYTEGEPVRALEQSVELGDGHHWPGGKVKTLWARELSRFGLHGKSALRAAQVMRAIAEQAGPTATACLQAKVTAKGHSERAVRNTVNTLLDLGFLAKEKRGRYTLTLKAIIQPTSTPR